MFLPPAVTIRSFFRSVIRKKPSVSISPMSPVANQPSSKNTSRRLFRSLVVPFGNVGTTGQDFAIWRDAQFHPGQSRTHRPEFIPVVAVGRQRGTGLRQAIALQDQHASGVEKFGDVLRQRRAARDKKPQASADALVQFLEHQLVCQALLQTQPGGDRLAVAVATDSPAVQRPHTTEKWRVSAAIHVCRRPAHGHRSFHTPVAH